MYSHHVSTLASASTSASGSSSFPGVAVTLVIVLLLLAKRVRGQELLPGKLIVLPFILMLLGMGDVAAQLAASKSVPIHLHDVHFHDIDYLILATDLALSVGIGSIRGFTVLIYPRNGRIWYRYGPLTVLLWFVSIGLRTLLGIIGAHHGALPLVTSGIVLLMFGLTLLIQNIVVVARRPGREAARPGAPLPLPHDLIALAERFGELRAQAGDDQAQAVLEALIRCLGHASGRAEHGEGADSGRVRLRSMLDALGVQHLADHVRADHP
jgi:hypothetical protein